MGEALKGLKRTVMCGELRENSIGNTITAMGWVQKKRNLGGLVFVDLRDRTGLLQVVFGEEINEDAFTKADTVKSEYCIAVTGKIVKREAPNENMPTGMVELLGENIKILSESETPPIYIKENLDAGENIRLKYRYLDLRRPDMQKIFMIRHKTAKVIRDFLDEKGFLEIETPILGKSTPEGARDYLVPSRNFNGKFYALPQSPQLLKQLLMVSGFDKYFQIAKCFRDEDLRANRQPEFTQVDMELSFVEEDDVILLNEELIKKVFKEIAGVDVKTPIERMPYKTAMEKYGSDKPDLRFGMEINDLSEVVKDTEFKVFKDTLENGGSVRAIKAEGCGSMGRKQIDKLGDFVKTFKAKGLAWIAVKENEIKSPIAKFFTEEQLKSIVTAIDAKVNDLILIVADKDNIVFKSLGELRLHLAKEMELLKNNKEFRFVWVTEFPLLSYNEEEKRFQAEHHPFTMPMDEDIKYLESDPGRVRAKAYDIVLNGEELGGGSIRIHETDLQEKMLKVLGFTKERAWNSFGFLLEAFNYGPPPHGGLAYGFDRLTMFLASTENIKDVIAFPKNQNAACVMTEAPNVVDDKQLDELGISVLKEEN
ncbi:aspartate--tRNA ligase [Clostridium pasteurianum DSM 525 = ATCC 6013]|uniref:Aspartate--tRNA ligase n=1 Tax=Clostridium pasteurianum DSM 525 = ATCC 6013 TaxID=1262449 RepID=A0A0H3J2Y4_CLOPA|nr:aspartate--tRNA ligase [Clostridium pasteurianum]AJA48286.1 aspartate--tRNA ligase [Clostridium pasteurianum DSM 525 = ATCC 6013]AJA52274.1 aspartate--tRNA ligase [Clostridium pasteurianum DSM 525 = ATCC 6013]AOZ75538.1 aspartate--tRNA(Asp/Asn) ligase [Clostridium pasteurianum DSM 525 = ATCC 6013]AOZ79333.1 aspartate--tRNA(Asp/Asn) ligase [Clostridium pasteurianum]ELP60564.1 aspartyl-tRNA ligase [Clostridium pasteurianum DSM 525 = ATCC 6013]